ncbi:MAG TPA: ester cyclase [Ktedonobacteraceae bacterium]|jgi:steroid delta-isomerase-like uncharacterized protein|nr:ester cyclase [Ktedonobacteraceae bacterium]
MSTETNKAVVQQFLEAWSKNDLATLASIVTGDWTNFDDNLPPLPRGPQGAQALSNLFHAGIPDMQVTFESVIAEGDLVAIRWLNQGTHTGELLGIPPTGKSASVRATGIFRVVDGKVAENHVNFDALGMLQQLGIVPPLGQPAQAI